MTTMDVLLSAAAQLPLQAQLDALGTERGSLPFAPVLTAFVGRLSRAILGDRRFREFPELMAMAHWCRPANLRDMRAGFLGEERTADVASGTLPVRRGVVFHIAPSNVDSVFIYSWLLSLLCGNVNIARVSRRRTPQMSEFFAVVRKLLKEPEFAPLARSNLVLSYEHDAAVTQAISARCHLRVVWGGDATIEQIRKIPLPALAGEIAFANRFSVAALRADAVLAADEAALAQLAHDFYNDAFWFNQQACSSPRAVFWVGDASQCEQAQARFWPALALRIAQQQPDNSPAYVMSRATTLALVAEAHVHARALTPPGAFPSRVQVDALSDADRSLHDGNGLFIEVQAAALADVVSALSPRDQTVACFGVHASEWRPLLGRLPPHAADRIVPIGQALGFEHVWDGVDLLQAFTRQVRV
jgi:hypothetical protein